MVGKGSTRLRHHRAGLAKDSGECAWLNDLRAYPPPNHEWLTGLRDSALHTSGCTRGQSGGNPSGLPTGHRQPARSEKSLQGEQRCRSGQGCLQEVLGRRDAMSYETGQRQERGGGTLRRGRHGSTACPQAQLDPGARAVIAAGIIDSKTGTDEAPDPPNPTQGRPARMVFSAARSRVESPKARSRDRRGHGDAG